MTKDELRVLEYVEHGLGGPETVVARLRPIFREMIAAGFVEEVSYYVLTPDGQEALEASRANQQLKEPK